MTTIISALLVLGIANTVFFDKENITVIVGNESMLDTLPVMTVEVFNFYIQGPLYSQGKLWTQRGKYGIAELLFKIQDQGKRIYLFVLSGTELVEGDLVSIVNS